MNTPILLVCICMGKSTEFKGLHRQKIQMKEQQNGMCAQQSLQSAWTLTQSDQNHTGKCKR